MDIRCETFHFPSANGQNRVFTRRWLPAGKPRAILMIAHGLSEHSGRYQDFAEYMADQGWLVLAHDHIGHGQSVNPGQRFGYMPGENGWQSAMADMEYLRSQAQEEYPDLPCYMLAHSMSSFLVRNYLIDYAPTQLSAVILSGSGQMSSLFLKLGGWVIGLEEKRLGPQGISMLLYLVIQGGFNRRFKPRRTAVDWLSSDTEMVDSYLADSFCRKLPTVSLYRHIYGAFNYTIKPANLQSMDKSLPILFISGEEDPLGHRGRSVQRLVGCFSRAGCENVDLKLYPNCRHALLHEKNRKQIYADIYAWLEDNLSKKRTQR